MIFSTRTLLSIVRELMDTSFEGEAGENYALERTGRGIADLLRSRESHSMLKSSEYDETTTKDR